MLKHIVKLAAIVAVITLSGCASAGQTFFAPVATSSTENGKNGKVTKTGARSHILFRNTGDLTNVKYNAQGPGYAVNFSADKVDNSTPTRETYNGLSKLVESVGSAGLKLGAGAALPAATGGASALIP